MMERKFTDEEVIKALECCANADCLNCPQWSEEWTSAMCSDFLPTVLDLVKRQRVEIAELKQKYELAVAEREANAKALIDMTAEKYPWERVNEKREDY